MRSSMKESISNNESVAFPVSLQEDNRPIVATRSRLTGAKMVASAARSSKRQNRSQRKATRTFVEHNYKDHFRDPVAHEVVRHFDSTKNKSMNCSGPTSNNVAFPEKLYHMLATAQGEYDHIVSWQPHGRCFLIRKKEPFVKEIMPRFFHQTKITSFQRQLNLYGFIRLTAGRDRGSYYHPFFLRGRPDLCCFMVRTKVKGNGMKPASSPETEPDFYQMEFCHDKLGFEGELKSLLPPSEQAAPAVSDLTMERVMARPHPKEPCNDLEAINPGEGFPDHANISLNHLHVTKPRVISPLPMTTLMSAAQQNVSDFLDSTLDGWNLLETTYTCELPETGDEVFFEGLKFHYLDHYDLDGDMGDILSDTAAV